MNLIFAKHLQFEQIVLPPLLPELLLLQISLTRNSIGFFSSSSACTMQREARDPMMRLAWKKKFHLKNTASTAVADFCDVIYPQVLTAS